MPRPESDSSLPVTIDRSLPPARLYPFTRFFKGFENVEAVRRVFGKETQEVLSRQKVEFVSSRFAYMGVNPDDGHILVGSYHLRNSRREIIYLDLVHELFHVRQFMEGKDLFPDGVEYVDSPIEVPAYRHTVEEARRIGMSFKEIDEYLRVEWVDDEQHKRLVRASGLDPEMKRTPDGHLPKVSIARVVPLSLEPFSKYFRGFEKVEAVKAIFGKETDEILRSLKVEFFSARWGYMGVNDVDGHLIVGTKYLQNNDPRTIYLDTIFALHQVKLFKEGKRLFGFRWGIEINPQTIDAYRSTVQEAKRIGMNESEIREYLEDEWIPPAQFEELLRAVGLGHERPAGVQPA